METSEDESSSTLDSLPGITDNRLQTIDIDCTIPLYYIQLVETSQTTHPLSIVLIGNRKLNDRNTITLALVRYDSAGESWYVVSISVIRFTRRLQ
jgi:hypothetical protein